MARTPITAEDLYRFRWVDCVRLSADGAHVAWEVTWPDREERENRAAVWVADTSAGPGSAVTDEQGRKRSPAWSPDGTRLAYLSREGSVDQVRVLDLSEAAESVPRQLTSLEDGVLAHRWSPDGTRIAFLARVLSEPELVVEDPRPPEGKAVHRPPVARVVRGFDWRFNGVGPYDGRRVHLFWVRADGGGEPQQVTSGPWSVEGFDWAPDGSRLAITGDDQPGADLRRTRDAFVVDLETGVLNRVVRDRFTSSPRWSPDGAHLAWIGPTEPGAGFFNRVWVLPVEPAGAEPQCLTGGFDAHVGGGVIGDMRVSAGPGLRWDASGQRLYFLASARGAVNLYSVDLSGEVRAELGFAHRALFDFDLAAGRIGLAANDASQPGEVFVAEAGGVAERQVTDENSWLRQRALVTPEPQEFRAADGTRLEGWLLRPEAASEAAPAPLVLEIHGGPNGQYGWAFMQEFQLLAGQGIGVLYLNPRGSDGYGQGFMREVVRDWGGRDAEDLLIALDQLVAREHWVDERRLGVAGGSYGGYMTNWLIGHTNRFRAAVSMRSISNLVSEYAQHDIVPWGADQLGPIEWPDPEELWRRSPLRYVRDIQTPLLLLHGEADLRCAISQAEELFGALHLLGREVELVRFPGEAHDLSRNGRPDRRVERLRRIAGWFGAHFAG